MCVFFLRAGPSNFETAKIETVLRFLSFSFLRPLLNVVSLATISAARWMLCKNASMTWAKDQRLLPCQSCQDSRWFFGRPIIRIEKIKSMHTVDVQIFHIISQQYISIHLIFSMQTIRFMIYRKRPELNLSRP